MIYCWGLICLLLVTPSWCQQRRDFQRLPVMVPMVPSRQQHSFYSSLGGRRRFSTTQGAEPADLDPEVRREMARNYVKEAFFTKK